MVRACLAPGGRVFFVDSLYEATSTASDHALGDAEATRLARRLNDGREFSIVKVFYQPEALEAAARGARMGRLCARDERYFLYGEGTAARGAPVSAVAEMHLALRGDDGAAERGQRVTKRVAGWDVDSAQGGRGIVGGEMGESARARRLRASAPSGGTRAEVEEGIAAATRHPEEIRA